MNLMRSVLVRMATNRIMEDCDFVWWEKAVTQTVSEFKGLSYKKLLVAQTGGDIFTKLRAYYMNSYTSLTDKSIIHRLFDGRKKHFSCNFSTVPQLQRERMLKVLEKALRESMNQEVDTKAVEGVPLLEQMLTEAGALILDAQKVASEATVVREKLDSIDRFVNNS